MNGTRHEREKGPPAHNIRPFMTDSTRSLICGMTVIAFTRCLFSSLCREVYAGLGLSRWRQSSTLFSSSSQQSGAVDPGQGWQLPAHCSIQKLHPWPRCTAHLGAR